MEVKVRMNLIFCREMRAVLVTRKAVKGVVAQGAAVTVTRVAAATAAADENEDDTRGDVVEERNVVAPNDVGARGTTRYSVQANE